MSLYMQSSLWILPWITKNNAIGLYPQKANSQVRESDMHSVFQWCKEVYFSCAKYNASAQRENNNTNSTWGSGKT